MLDPSRHAPDRPTLLKEIRRGGLPPSRLRRACDYMVSRLGEDVSLQEVAASVELSTGHFSTAFKQSSGVTPHAWMRRQRIDRAKTLLHDANLNLTQIAIILDLSQNETGGFVLAAALAVTMAGIDQQAAERLVQGAHAIWPYPQLDRQPRTTRRSAAAATHDRRHDLEKASEMCPKIYSAPSYRSG